MTMTIRDSCNRTSWVAIALIVAGVVLILNNFNILNIDIGDIWPLIFVVVGISKLNSGRPEDKSGGWIFLTIGIAFTLTNLGVLEWDIMWRFFWPVMLIVCGAAILLRHLDSDHRERGESSKQIHAVSFFGSNERVVTATDFEGGTITTLFGETKLDFGRATLAPGESTLDLLVMFGGTEIKAPPTLRVVIKALPVFGSAEDSRRKTVDANPEENRCLVVKGLILFGGLKIKDA